MANVMYSGKIEINQYVRFVLAGREKYRRSKIKMCHEASK